MNIGSSAARGWLIAALCIILGFITALAFFVYQSPEMAFNLDGFALCN
ncbi:MAG: hypothetical protein R3E89_10520 [Thiolinea sp.]